MTTNKSQGQSLTYVGVFFQENMSLVMISCTSLYPELQIAGVLKLTEKCCIKKFSKFVIILLHNFVFVLVSINLDFVIIF